MTLVLIPDVGDLLRVSPQYNAGTLVELVRREGAREVVWASALDAEHPGREALDAAGFALVDVTPDWAFADAEAAKLQEFLRQYPQGRERLMAAGNAQRELATQLGRPLSAGRVMSADLLGAAGAYHAAVREALGEGPGTTYRERRLAELAGALRDRQGVAVAALDDVPDLLSAVPGARLPDVSNFTPGETSRLRALADRALLLQEDDDLQGLVEGLLREDGDAVTPRAELRYAAANVYLAVGDLRSARELLEEAAHAITDRPRSLPGLVLARLGQVRDAAGDRDLAVRAYRAVLALSFAPEVALVTAREGIEVPFTLEAED